MTVLPLSRPLLPRQNHLANTQGTVCPGLCLQPGPAVADAGDSPFLKKINNNNHSSMLWGSWLSPPGMGEALTSTLSLMDWIV